MYPDYITQDEMKTIVADPANEWTRNPDESVNKKYFANPKAYLPMNGRPMQIMYMSNGNIYTNGVAYYSWFNCWCWWDSDMTVFSRVLAWRPCPPELMPDDCKSEDDYKSPDDTD